MMKDREKLIEIFVETNSQINLSAIRQPEDIYKKHILDSIELNKFWTIHPGTRVCDLGTGGGFPLLPLAMTNPDVNFVGMDSVNKKVEAVKKMASQLNLKNVELIWGRGEEYKGEQFDYVVSRAVAYIDKLLQYSHKLLKKGGYFIFYKMYTPEELDDVEKLCKRYKMKLHRKYRYNLFDGDIERVIYVIKE